MLVGAQVSPMHPSLCGSSPFRLSRPAMRAPELAEGLNIRPFRFPGGQSFFNRPIANCRCGTRRPAAERPALIASAVSFCPSSVIVRPGCAAPNARTLSSCPAGACFLWPPKLSRPSIAGCRNLPHELDHPARADLKAARRHVPKRPGQNRPEPCVPVNLARWALHRWSISDVSWPAHDAVCGTGQPSSSPGRSP